MSQSMKVLCFGSLNIDYVYQVPHFVRPGETLSAENFSIYCGGKGLNQSIALSRAGLSAYHAGKIGEDGRFLLEKLRENGVDVRWVTVAPGATGHAIIQVEPGGQNCILLHGGCNRQVSEEEMQRVFSGFGPGDLLLIQNEINNPEVLIRLGKAQGMRVAMNPAPMDAGITELPLELVDILILNEIEGQALSGASDPEAMARTLLARCPQGQILITLGAQGAYYEDAGGRHRQPAHSVQPVDTTAAGDTFTGFFLAGLVEALPVADALKLASRAAALCVTRAGAAESIPYRHEVDRLMP